MTALPTRKMETYRYADIEALASVWTSLATPQRIEIAAQQTLQQIWLPNADPVQVRRVEIALEAGATANIFALNTASTYGRIEIDVTLADGAHFGLDAANIGGSSPVASGADSITTGTAAAAGLDHLPGVLLEAVSLGD